MGKNGHSQDPDLDYKEKAESLMISKREVVEMESLSSLSKALKRVPKLVKWRVKAPVSTLYPKFRLTSVVVRFL